MRADVHESLRGEESSLRRVDTYFRTRGGQAIVCSKTGVVLNTGFTY